MNNCDVFRDAIQSWIHNGKLKFPEKTQMLVDADLFPLATVGMMDAYLSKDKKKGKVDHPRLPHPKTKSPVTPKNQFLSTKCPA